LEISGEVEIKNVDKAKEFLSSYQNLINCIPGVTEIKGKEFTVRSKVGFLTVEAEARVKSFEFRDNESVSVIEVKGVGVTSTITSRVKVDNDKLIYKIEYEVQVTIKGLEKLVEKQAHKIAEDIITCTKQRIDE
jgi:carbon monoxide dehydrogenase subunit G